MRKRIGILLLGLLLLLALPVRAQEVTATLASDVATETNGSAAINLITLIAGIGVGVVTGGGSVLFVVNKFRNDKAIVTALEQLGASFPPQTRELLNNLAGLMYEITDDVPFNDKPAGSTS